MNRMLQSIPRPVFYALTIIAGGLLFTKFIFPYTAPFVFAALVAVLIDPIVNITQRRLNIHRGFAVLLVLLLFFSLVALVGATVLIKALTELQDLAVYSQRMAILDLDFDSWIQSYRALQEYIPANLSLVLDASIQDLNNYLSETARGMLAFVVNLIKDIPKILLYTLVTFLAAFFMSKDKQKIGVGLLQLIPERYHDRLKRTIDGVAVGAMGYIRAQLIIVSITTVIATTSFLLQRLPYVWFLAGLIFVMDFIPVIGPSMIFLPFAGWSLVQGNPRQAVFLVISYAVIAVTRQSLEPKLIGDRIGVHPLLTLFALFVGVRVFGLIGIIAAPLIVIVVKTLLLTADGIQATTRDTKKTLEA